MINENSGRRPPTPQENFTAVARHYDRVNRMLTLGNIDRIRKKAVGFLNPNSRSILDMCCGTGEMGKVIRKKFPAVVLTGVDLNKEMLNQAVKKCSYDFLILQNADYGATLADCYDGVILSLAYHDLGSIRLNVLELLHKKLSEDGRFISIELSLPPNTHIRLLVTSGLKLMRKLFLCANLNVIAHTVEEILESPTSSQLIREFESKGFVLCESQLFLFGLIHMNIFRKES